MLKLHGHYWAIQAGLLTPLTFARNRLSPLAAFTSGAYSSFFTMVHWYTMVGGESEFANFTLPTLKAFLEARRHNVSGNKQGRFQYAHLQSIKVAWTL